ncbi:hypothetical protein Kpol_1065p15 [Vanderwaltozyma polyspora DSM 70294]|uniref:C2H2-type domain-containing protein n=1 Tax=Vanderwaltozyma polyspora (strain ATCC 22028 / DSM 70294 / BCRC 21397 / CBS 2163 / NBRC 10782 / NRRL Y-8283 / UCD 57-17) TaxID=436907 RepID=A7TL37_VANPO|nr:uncharacterized protein Kpol_1065p15 [Vanderwaltozyma polyspora DSM 70294]EDO17000.1 hypothetical protein Kpol_1065p15 [Vanderwaltozyma polyspora DSM 70294]
MPNMNQINSNYQSNIISTPFMVQSEFINSPVPQHNVQIPIRSQSSSPLSYINTPVSEQQQQQHYILRQPSQPNQSASPIQSYIPVQQHNIQPELHNPISFIPQQPITSESPKVPSMKNTNISSSTKKSATEKKKSINNNIPVTRKKGTGIKHLSIEKRRRFECKTCGRKFTTSGHLTRHNRIHTGEKNHVCPFEGCNLRFSRNDNSLQHYKTHLKKQKKK